MSESFQVGDVVKLRGAGPLMTVESVTPSNVKCVWWCHDHYDRASFGLDVLEKVKTEP